MSRCLGASPGVRPRSNLYLGGLVEVFLDQAGDQRQVCELQINPANDVLDIIFLCTGTPAHDRQLITDLTLANRDVWALRERDWPGLKSAAAPWKVDGAVVGWIVDVAMPAQPTLRRLGRTTYADGLALRANLLRYDWFLGPDGAPVLLSLDCARVLQGNPHRSPAALGTFVLVDRLAVK